MKSPTVVIGFAGVSLPLDGMPFLREWSASGVQAGLSFPAGISDVGAWTSMANGQSPAQHGIFDLFRRQTPAAAQWRVLVSRDVAAEPIWSSVDSQGLKATLLNYPMTFPAPKIGGHVLPGSWVPAKRLKLGCHPSSLYRDLSALEGVDLGELTAEPLFRVLHHLMEKEPSDLTVMLVRDAGALDPAGIDRHLERVIQSAGAHANILVIAAPASKQSFSVNAWLAEHGYLAQASTVDGPVVETADLQRHSASIDWARTQAWCPPGGGHGIFIVRQDSDHPNGVPEAEYTEFQNRLQDQLQSLPGVVRVWKQEELYAGPFQDLAPDLTVELAGSTEGTLFAKGPALKRGASVSSLPLSAVTPLLYYMLELRAPDQMVGSVPTEILDPEWLEKHPLTSGAASHDPASEKPLINPEDEEEILRSLRALGYME